MLEPFQQRIVLPLPPKGEAAQSRVPAQALCPGMESYPRSTTLALPCLSNKHLNYSLLAIKMLSWSRVVNLCKENLTSIKFQLKLGLPGQVEAQLYWLHQPQAPGSEHHSSAPLEAHAGVSQGPASPSFNKSHYFSFCTNWSLAIRRDGNTL